METGYKISDAAAEYFKNIFCFASYLLSGNIAFHFFNDVY
jgi:hypothetical protein